MTVLMMPAVSLVSIGVGIFLLKANSTFVGILFIFFGAWLVLLSAFGALMCSSIIVTGESIAARNVGRTLKVIRWENVTRAKKVRNWNPGSQSFQDTFYVFDGTFPPLRERMVNLRGPIAFTDKMRGLRRLLDTVNEAARRYEFPLVALDQEAARKLAAQRQAGAWERTVPKVEEVRLTAF